MELATVAQVKQAYYELYFIQQAISITESEEVQLAKIRDSANARYRATLTSQQDVLRADLELSNIANELIRLHRQLDSARRDSPACCTRRRKPSCERWTISPTNSHRRTWRGWSGARSQPDRNCTRSSPPSSETAVQRLARLDYVPDLTLGATWIDTASAGISPVANGQDAVLLTAGVNLPIYRKRLDSGVRSAEASAVATARDYDALRDATLEQVADLFAKARSQQDLLMLFREDILPTARQTLEVSNRTIPWGRSTSCS